MTREEIIKEFDKAGINCDAGVANYIDDTFTPVLDLVEKLVKNCSIPDVIGQSEQLKNAEQEGYKKGWEEGAQYGYSAAHEGR